MLKIVYDFNVSNKVLMVSPDFSIPHSNHGVI